MVKNVKSEALPHRDSDGGSVELICNDSSPTKEQLHRNWGVWPLDLKAYVVLSFGLQKRDP